jgi:uncharacterized protein
MSPFRRRLGAVVLAAVVPVSVATAARAASFPEPTGYVVDEAGALPDDEQEALEAELAAYAARSGHQIAVAVVTSTGNESIEDYANDLFGAWGVGTAERDDGVLIVVATSDRRLRIEVGRGLEGQLTDIEAADIVRDEMVPPLRAGRLPDAVRAGERAVRAALDDPTPQAAGDPQAQSFNGFGGGRPAAAEQGGGLGLLPLLALAFVAFAVLSRLGRRRRRRRGGLFFPVFLGSGWGSTSWDGGGLGAGGGGFGGFGGGSSGGGGASGSW